MSDVEKKRKEIVRKWSSKMEGMTVPEKNAFIKQNFSDIYGDLWNFAFQYGTKISIANFIDVADLRLG